jgi:hypothetical protein
VTESLLNFLASWGYKISKKEKAQLCLLQVTYLGAVLKGQVLSLSHEQIHPILHFPLPHTIKQPRVFLGVTGFYRIWIPRYAALARLFFYAPAILLFGPCIINALYRFISQQVQRLKLHLLVKKYSPLPTHEPSIHSIGGPWRLQGSTPETSTPSPILPWPHCQHEAARPFQVKDLCDLGSFTVPGMELRALLMLGRPSTTDLAIAFLPAFLPFFFLF